MRHLLQRLAPVLCMVSLAAPAQAQGDPFGGGGDPFGGGGDPFGGGGDPFGGGGDPFGGGGDPFGGGGDPFGGGGGDPFGGGGGDPFGGGGDPFGGGGGDPFGGGGDDDFFDPDLLVNGGGSSEPIHTTIRFGPGMPELAVEPGEESGAILFEVNTPLGALPILVQPAGPALSLTPPPPVEPRGFRPPSIFSAPLPTGSGARALGFAGAFTAIADDATAASWNPAGLIQLKRPEVSAVYRYSRVDNEHTSRDADFQVGDDDYNSGGLNYLTASLPFLIPGLEHNAVFSLNYQEAYDFEHAFTARFRDAGQQRFSRSNQQTFTETQIDRFVFEPGALRSEVEIVTDITTRSSSALSQTIDTTLEAELDFEQEGVIDAIAPVLAVELNPRFAIGVAINVYQDNTAGSGNIRSRTRSTYTAVSDSRSRVVNRQATSGRYQATEATVIPAGFLGDEDVIIPSEPTSGSFPAVVQEQTLQRRDVRIVDGEIVEINEYDDLSGVNATLGLWWVVNDVITLGAAVDLPWDAETEQTRRTTTRTTTYDANRSRILGTSETSEEERNDVEFEFPLYGAVGAFFLWNPNLYTAVDVGYARWSDFAYDVKGQGRINPFDGTPHGQNDIDDTWSARLGTEYLLQWDAKKLEVPLRAGLVWEQRPAVGQPDDYYGFSVGTGVAIGEDEGQWIVDVAYNYLRADDVQTVAPEQGGLTTDTVQQQIFVSLIKHF